MIGHLLRSVDFERVLGRPSCARSPHFAVHFLASSPSGGRRAGQSASGGELSTALQPGGFAAVDEALPVACVQGAWLGSVVPKRHARRAVTRNLLKRQIRHAVDRQSRPPEGAAAGVGLPDGLWVVRLRSPFDLKSYPSAASAALTRAAAEELSSLLAQAARRVAA